MHTASAKVPLPPGALAKCSAKRMGISVKKIAVTKEAARRRKHRADFRGLLHVSLRADSLVAHVFVEFRVTLLAALQVPVQIARNGEQVAFHRRLTDSFAGQPRGHKRVRSDFICHHGITGEKQDKSTNVGRIALIKTLDVRHFQRPFKLRANTRKVTSVKQQWRGSRNGSRNHIRHMPTRRQSGIRSPIVTFTPRIKKSQVPDRPLSDNNPKTVFNAIPKPF